MPLTDVTIRKVAAAKPLRLVDGEGGLAPLLRTGWLT